MCQQEVVITGDRSVLSASRLRRGRPRRSLRGQAPRKTTITSITDFSTFSGKGLACLPHGLTMLRPPTWHGVATAATGHQGALPRQDERDPHASPPVHFLPLLVLIVLFPAKPLREEHQGCTLQCVSSFTRGPLWSVDGHTGTLPSTASALLILAGPATNVLQPCPSSGLRIRIPPIFLVVLDLHLSQPTRTRPATISLSRRPRSPRRALFSARHEEPATSEHRHPASERSAPASTYRSMVSLRGMRLLARWAANRFLVLLVLKVRIELVAEVRSSSMS